MWICGCYTGCWIRLNKPENALIMSKYGWICLNNAEYNWICRHTSEKTECWICQSSRCVWCSIKHNVTEQITEHLLRQRCIQNIVKHLRGVVLQRERCLSASAQPAIFQGSGERYFDKHFVKNTRRGSTEKCFGNFCPRSS